MCFPSNMYAYHNHHHPCSNLIQSTVLHFLMFSNFFLYLGLTIATRNFYLLLKYNTLIQLRMLHAIVMSELLILCRIIPRLSKEYIHLIPSPINVTILKFAVVRLCILRDLIHFWSSGRWRNKPVHQSYICLPWQCSVSKMTRDVDKSQYCKFAIAINYHTMSGCGISIIVS